MSDTTASLHRKLYSAGDLQSLVHTMKAMAASNIGQYENAVRSLDDYYRTVQLGLSAGFRQASYLVDASAAPAKKVGAVGTIGAKGKVGAIVFGSDQGLVGQFNDVIADFAVTSLAPLPGKKMVWAVGERIHSRLAETELATEKSFALPNSINAISNLIGEILIDIETRREQGEMTHLFLLYNRRTPGSVYAPVSLQLLPLDDAWRRELAATVWPSKNLPEVMHHKNSTMSAFVREYLFVSLYMACAHSLASENASRLAAMQRAEKKITELLDDLNQSFHRLRQSGIDEELFDVVSGFEAFAKP